MKAWLTPLPKCTSNHEKQFAVIRLRTWNHTKLKCYRIRTHRKISMTVYHRKVSLKKCARKNKQKQTQNNQTSGSCRDRKWVSSFLWIYLTGYGDKSPPAEHEPTGQKPKSVQKPTDWSFFFSFISLMSPFVNRSYLYIDTWASLQSSLHMLPLEFATRSYSTPHKTAVFAPLCHIQHHTRWQSLSLCNNLIFT